MAAAVSQHPAHGSVSQVSPLRSIRVFHTRSRTASRILSLPSSHYFLLSPTRSPAFFPSQFLSASLASEFSFSSSIAYSSFTCTPYITFPSNALLLALSVSLFLSLFPPHQIVFRPPTLDREREKDTQSNGVGLRAPPSHCLSFSTSPSPSPSTYSPAHLLSRDGESGRPRDEDRVVKTQSRKRERERWMDVADTRGENRRR